MNRGLCPVLCTVMSTAVTLGAADTIVFQGGTEIIGEVIAIDANTILIQADDMRVTFDRARIVSIQPHTATDPDWTSRAAVAPSRKTIDAPHWSLSAGVAAGWVIGSVSGAGAVVDNRNGSTANLTTKASIGDFGLQPGLWIRATTEPRSYEAGWQIGVHASLGQFTADDAYLKHGTLSAVVGWATPPAPFSSYLHSRLGITRAQADRSLAVGRRDGVPESIDTSGTLLGWSIAAEAGGRRRSGWLDYGLAAGIEHGRLSGDASWTSPSGNFSGTEDLTAVITSIYVTLSIGASW